MPEFVLDTAGEVHGEGAGGIPGYCIWADLDTFAQGYIEAMFFTDSGDEEGQLGDLGFSDLAPDTLAAIIRDCAAFQETRAWADALENYSGADETTAGRDFWYTRQGHGCGFWDGDWPEPHGDALTEAAKAFRAQDSYVGDDGKVRFAA